MNREMDALARQRGFPDYATWLAWTRHRNAAPRPGMGQGSADATYQGNMSAGAPQVGNNILQSLVQGAAANAWPSFRLLNHVNRRVSSAMSGGR